MFLVQGGWGREEEGEGGREGGRKGGREGRIANTTQPLTTTKH